MYFVRERGKERRMARWRYGTVWRPAHSLCHVAVFF